MLTASSFNPPLAAFGIDWFREPASTGAAAVDTLYFWILGLCIFFFFLITGLTVAFVARYYARPGHTEEHTAHHNNTLEAAWSIFPGFLVVAIFWYGFVGYLDLRTPPENAYEIQVVAKKWNWSFMYPNGVVDPNLHVPADQPVKLLMSSDDVLHSLYIPAFRVKLDCVPGRYSELWFEATKPTESFDPDKPITETGSDENGYDLFCTEYCGQGHSAMLAKVIVHKSGTFETWLEDAAKVDPASSPAELGKNIWKYRGCAQCHSVDGAAGLAGPSWKGTYGTKQQVLVGGKPEEIKIDENYIRESILEPMNKIRQGYAGVMPSYQGQLKEAEIAGVIWYIKSLQEGEKVPTTWTEVGGVPGQEEKPEEKPADGATPAADAPAAESKPADDQPAAEVKPEEKPAA